MSFFKKFTPAGSSPIVTQKRVIKTNNMDDTTSIKLKGSRVSSTTLRRTLTPPTPDIIRSPPTQKARLSAKSAPNLKRPRNGNDNLKPPSPESLGSRGRSTASSRSPKSLRLESSDSEDSEDDRQSKRSKVGSSSPMVLDQRRKMVHPISFHTRNKKTGEPVAPCEFIHADVIANVSLKNWGKRKEFRKSDNGVQHVGLHYPGIPQQERFQLAENIDPDEFDPVAEILTTMERVAIHLTQPEIGEKIHSEISGGIVYRMRRALKHGDSQKFVDHLKEYNALVRQCRKDGTFKKRITGMVNIPITLVEHILQQSYARTVALEVEGLRNYQAFSSEVYGELLPKFTTKMFKESGLTSDKVFVDLGSGTGNVVLHAALEIGCESWGCEKMNKPAELAARQRKEFIARCRMWGINHGSVHLEHDTFLENQNIAKVLKRADVLLVNNFAFEPDLNQKLLDIFLDLKEGAQIFSLKPFVPANHVITTRNRENPVNRLRMVEREYFSREVSWTDAGGKYYIHTVDGSMLKDFAAKEDRLNKRQ